MKVLSRIYVFLIFLLLYIPILMLVLFSFNRGGTLNSFTGFSFYWYRELLKNSEALNALKNSLYLAVSSAVLSTVIGTLGALGIDRMRSKHVKNAVAELS